MDLENYSLWIEANRLPLNASKPKLVFRLGRRYLGRRTRLVMDTDTVAEQVRSQQIFRCIID